MATQALSVNENADQMVCVYKVLLANNLPYVLVVLGIVLGVVLVTGFVLGWFCMLRVVGGSSATNVVRITKKSKIPRRTIGTQSMTTYKRHLTQPRFCLMPSSSDGVFVDVSFSQPHKED